MLTDLSFLDTNKPWPPDGEADRLEKYNTNKQLFEGNHADVYATQFHRIERVIGNFEDVISYAVLANFQKLLSVKTADLLLGEPPIITVGGDNPDQELINSIDKISKNSDLMNTADMLVIDVSRYGDGLFYIHKDADLKAGTIDVTQPPIWFPVVSSDNVKKILYHVLAWRYDVEVPPNGFWQSLFSDTKSDKKSYLKVQIHSKGSYEERVYELEVGTNTRIIKQESTNTVNTGLDDFAVIQVPNLITSDRVTGLDDYTDIDSLVSELEVRISQIARILDKHAAPSVQGPAAAIEKDPRTGEWKLKMGSYFPRRSNDDPKVEYLTWDAELDANFKIIDKIINLLYTISEMGSAIFGDMEGHKAGNVPSGTALRRLMISPLAKAARIRKRLDPALKKAIKLCSQLGGEGVVNLKDAEINISWQDGLPADPLESAQIEQIRTGNKATTSVESSIKRLDGLYGKALDEEIEKIDEDESKANPIGGQNFPNADGGNIDNGGNGDEQ